MSIFFPDLLRDLICIQQSTSTYFLLLSMRILVNLFFYRNTCMMHDMVPLLIWSNPTHKSLPSLKLLSSPPHARPLHAQLTSGSTHVHKTNIRLLRFPLPPRALPRRPPSTARVAAARVVLPTLVASGQQQEWHGARQRRQ